MVGINGIGNVPELANTKPEPVRDRKKTDSATVSLADGVQISSEAQRATEVARLAQLSQAQNDIRQKEVEEARKNIEQGTYKTVNAILQVAARVGKLL
ncbi:MAG: flagellar biosynthesis anti-sigma factor FlgM [Candidatus Hydrogenedentes bacterium]|nr:flagellar biosynthesis anti-sigma factor FlgM [Candidatus Hydrogenedentota bacterium]